MIEIPETLYASTEDGLDIAYQVFGDGPADLVFVHRFVSTIGYMWDVEPCARFLSGLGRIARVLALDPRGAGLSDRELPPRALALELRTLDLTAVMDAAGWQRASLLGAEDGGSLCALFAATYPQRVDRLILHTAYACGHAEDDYPWGWTIEEWDAYLEETRTGWGDNEWMYGQVRDIAPSEAADPALRRQLVNLYRLGAGTKRAVEVFEIQRDLDIRSVLPAIQAPTLIIHPGNSDESVEHATYMADRIKVARSVEIAGADFDIYSGNVEDVLAEIREFLLGTRAPPESNRVLATVMFTDVVDSTRRAAELGDAAWRGVLAAHNVRVRAELERFRGIEVGTAGDGFLARFDGPARAVQCGQAITRAVKPLGIDVRVGCHTSEIELDEDDIGGIGVHIGARVSALAGPGEVLVSRTVKDLVAGSGLTFEDAGEHELKGVPDRWRLYKVVGG